MRQAILLGTAQWGQNYGATNPRDRLNNFEVANILKVALDAGIVKLDTAPSYHDAEVRVSELASTFQVQTKFTARNRSLAEIDRVVNATLGSYLAEQRPSILVHDWSVLTPCERQWSLEVLLSAKSSGQARSVGISIYEEPELDNHLDDVSQLDVVQLPVSLLDQRFVASSLLDTLRTSGVRIQARSIFLQGLLLGEPVRHALSPKLMEYKRMVDDSGSTAIDLCVGFVKSQDWIDEVVVGVTSDLELKEIMKAFISSDIDLEWSDWHPLTLI